MINTDDDPFGVLDDPLGILNAPLGVPGAGDVAPITSLPPQGLKEHRKGTRYSAAWKVTVAADGQLHTGRTKDISLHGAAILTGCNLKPGTGITLQLYLTSLTGPGAPKILTIHGMTSYAIHDSTDLYFRVGVTFIRFEQASDRAYLEERLANYHTKVF